MLLRTMRVVYWVDVSESFDAPDKEPLNGCCVVL